MTRELEGEVERLCNLSQGIYDKGYDKATEEHIKNLMRKKGWDIEECMDTLDIPEEKKALYRTAILGVAVTA